MVMVDGELLLDGDELSRVDEARIRARGRERAERLAGLAR